MTADALVVSRDPDLRHRVFESLHAAGWTPLDFSDANSAFLCACGRVASLGAVVIDEAVGSEEMGKLLRRLRLLVPDLPTLVLRRNVCAGSQVHGAHEIGDAERDANDRRRGVFDRLCDRLDRFGWSDRPERGEESGEGASPHV